MRVLVTGGAGFIGSHLLPELIKLGHHLIVVDNLSSGQLSNIPSKVVFYQEDIINGDKIDKIFYREKPEIVYHLAAQTSVPYSINHSLEDAQANIIGSINILNSCINLEVSKYIFTSSAAVYGKPEVLPIDERHTICPLSGYGVSKYTSEKYAELYGNIYGLNYLIFRCANIYGERQAKEGEGGVVSIFQNAITNNEPLCIYGDGKQTRDFIYVKDVISAAINGIYRGDKATVNISTGSGTSVNSLVSIVESVNQKSATVINRDPRPGDIKDSVLNNRMACSVLKWEPVYNIEEGILDMVKQ